MGGTATGATLGSSSVPYADVIRTGGQQGFIGPGIAMVYGVATWQHPYRPAMLAVAALAMVVNGLMWWRAEAVARSRARIGLRWAGSLVSVVCLAILSALSGGV